MKKEYLLDVCDAYQPQTIAAKNLKGGQYPVYGANGIIGYHTAFNHESPELVMGCRGTCGALHITAPFSWINGNAMVIHPKKGVNLSRQYLYYAILSESLRDVITGTANPQITQTNLKKLCISTCDDSEQARIVARIEEMFSQLDAGVETLKKTKTQLAVYRQAVLKEAFSQVSNYGSERIKTLCQNIVDCPHSTPKWAKDGYLCLRTTNFKRGILDLSEKNYVTKETFDTRNARLVPLPGDVLYSREGAILGIACIIPEDTYVCLGQRMMLLRPSKKLNNRYLMHYLNSPTVTSFVTSITGGSASPHVNVADIKSFIIPCPEIRVQERIVMEIDSRISVCDSIEQTVDITLQQAEAMRQSILKDAFEGRL